MKKIINIFILISLSSFAYSASYNEQAEKDRKALVKYFKNKFGSKKQMSESMVYFTKEEIDTKLTYNLKFDDFNDGVYAFAKAPKAYYDELMEFPPYEDEVDEGQELFNTGLGGKSYKSCLGGVAVKGQYPKFDDKTNSVITVEGAINKCRTDKGLKPYKRGGAEITKISGYIAEKSRGQKINVKIQSKKAQEAYERGKKFYYSQRGYLGMSCATCHVQGAGKRVRVEYLSPLLGQVTHFPVYRVKWGKLGTLQKRIAGCQRGQGAESQELGSKAYNEVEYFMTYMSNGLKYNGPDLRK